MQFTNSSLSIKTDIKSLRKAAKQAISPELMKRVNKIIKTETFSIDDNHKIHWIEKQWVYKNHQFFVVWNIPHASSNGIQKQGSST